MATPLREFESPLPHNFYPRKAAPVAAFIMDEKNYVNFMSTSVKYRKPRLVQAKQGWYITYTYKVPEAVRFMYNNKTWHRFRIIEDMNRRKGAEREAFAAWLLNNITDALKNGYNPFQVDLDGIAEITENGERLLPVTVDEAFKKFLEVWHQRGLDEDSLRKYRRFVNRLAEYLHKNGMLYGDIKKLKRKHIEAFLQESRSELNLSNREYNNTLDFISTCFNYLKKEKIIDESPCDGIYKQKAVTRKHRFYNSGDLKAITSALMASDPYAHLAFQSVYYLCIRSDKELMKLQVGNIQWEQNRILLEAETTKAKAAQYIPLDENIKQLFLQHGIQKYPKDYYVFGVDGTPSPKPFSHGFFARRFRKVRDAAGLSDAFTLYGAKHTRIIHLKQDGLDDATIMALTRHRDFMAYAKYLRDLGLDANPDKINKVSRKL